MTLWPHQRSAVEGDDGLVNRPSLFVELCAGTAALSLRLHGGRYARPPVSRMGAKTGYADAILEVLGLRPGQGADHYLWCEPDDGARLMPRRHPRLRPPALVQPPCRVAIVTSRDNTPLGCTYYGHVRRTKRRREATMARNARTDLIAARASLAEATARLARRDDDVAAAASALAAIEANRAEWQAKMSEPVSDDDNWLFDLLDGEPSEPEFVQLPCTKDEEDAARAVLAAALEQQATCRYDVASARRALVFAESRVAQYGPVY